MISSSCLPNSPAQSSTTIDVYSQYVLLNQEIIDHGIYTLKEHLTQSRGSGMNAKITCSDPDHETNSDGSPNIEYYRYTFDILSDGNWVPMGYFIKTDMEILYKACKNREIRNGDNTISGTRYTTYTLIEALFGGDYIMRDANDNEMWSKPYFEEVTLPDGTKDYVLQTPTLDNGFFLYGDLITYLKASTATINASVQQADGSVVTRDWPVSEFVHTKFMLLNAVVE